MSEHNENCAINHNSIDDCDCERGQLRALRAREIELAKTLLLSAEKSRQLESENDSLRARVRELEDEVKRGMAWADRVEKLRLETANSLTRSIENGNEQEVTIVLLRLTVEQLKARIRELEEAMPDAGFLRVLAYSASKSVEVWSVRLDAMADHIEKVMTKQPEEN